MNKEEMNDYLQSIGGLIRTWRSDKGPILDAAYLGVSEGWFPLIKALIDELLALGWNRRIHQVKEKFGGLSFYADTLPEDGIAIIQKYEALSRQTCEMCGQTGVLRKGDWIKTLCDEHAQGREALSTIFQK